MRIKITDIADRLGISKTTVSLALNHKPGISEETRAKIIACKEEMLREGYTVYEHRVIKVLLFSLPPQLSRKVGDGFYQRMLSGIKEALHESQFDLELLHLPDSAEGLLEGARICNREKVAGVFLLASAYTAMPDALGLSALNSFTMPVILYDSDFHTIKYDQVRADNEEAVQIALRYCMHAGHKHIVYLSSGKGEYYNIRKREECAEKFKEDYKNKGIRLEIVTVGDQAFLNVEKELEEYFRREKELPTAFVADNQATSALLLEQLEKNGLQVPEDCSVIGIDPPNTLNKNQKRLTYVDLLDESRGLFAARRLIDRVNGRAREIIRVAVSPVFVEGETVKRIII